MSFLRYALFFVLLPMPALGEILGDCTGEFLSQEKLQPAVVMTPSTAVRTDPASQAPEQGLLSFAERVVLHKIHDGFAQVARAVPDSRVIGWVDARDLLCKDGPFITMTNGLDTYFVPDPQRNTALEPDIYSVVAVDLGQQPERLLLEADGLIGWVPFSNIDPEKRAGYLVHGFGLRTEGTDLCVSSQQGAPTGTCDVRLPASETAIWRPVPPQILNFGDPLAKDEFAIVFVRDGRWSEGYVRRDQADLIVEAFLSASQFDALREHLQPFKAGSALTFDDLSALILAGPSSAGTLGARWAEVFDIKALRFGWLNSVRSDQGLVDPLSGLMDCEVYLIADRLARHHDILQIAAGGHIPQYVHSETSEVECESRISGMELNITGRESASPFNAPAAIIERPGSDKVRKHYWIPLEYLP